MSFLRWAASSLVIAVATHLPATGLWADDSAASRSVTVFAAASLTSALTEILPRGRYPEVSLSFASSSWLARQIEAGAPADLYLSADDRWMDYLEARQLLEPGTRAELVTNRLVVIAPRGEGFEVRPAPGFDFASSFSGRLAVGDPDHVPAGRYARETLQALGWWTGLADRLASAPHVRAALTFVERGECSAGVVYATDAMISDRVEVVVEFPHQLHTPIRYPVAVVRGRRTAAVTALLERLQSPAAMAVFARHGFGRLDAQESSVARP